MTHRPQPLDPQTLAAQIVAEVRALPNQTTPAERMIRQKYSRYLSRAAPPQVLELAHMLIERCNFRWFAYELIRNHRPTFASLTPTEIEALGRGIDSWWTVDGFACTLSGPAWQAKLIPDELIHAWARSPDRWQRRAALVSTTGLNVRARGGRGDLPRTLAVCQMLVDDKDDMVVKAMSWALRELVNHDPQAVSNFLAENESRLAARVKREVRNKLQTGLKNPRRKMP